MTILQEDLTKPVIPAAVTITHQHLVSVLATELQPTSPLRVLDIGCGGGQMMRYFQLALGALFPVVPVEIYGLDAAGHGAFSEHGNLDETLAYLSHEVPDIPWVQRLQVAPTGEEWPWPDKFFDAAVSNQVLEHVHDFDNFFRQTYRVLKPGGISVHLFPLRNYIYEGHLFVPFGHRILRHDLAVAYLRFMHRFGFGRLEAPGKRSNKGFADPVLQADWLRRFTNYAGKKEFLTICRKYDFRTSFRYTRQFYSSKLRQVLGLPPKYRYKKPGSVILDSFSFAFLKYVSSITLFLQRPEYPDHTELLFPR